MTCKPSCALPKLVSRLSLSRGLLMLTPSAGGFETRLWSTPRWPTFVRDRVWRTLYDLCVYLTR